MSGVAHTALIIAFLIFGLLPAIGIVGGLCILVGSLSGAGKPVSSKSSDFTDPNPATSDL